MMSERSELSENTALYLQAAERAARAAGNVLREMLGAVNVQHKKNRFDLVTEADVNAQNIVKSILLETFPTHSFLGEEDDKTESKDKNVSPFVWIVDPLDGTTNYVHCVPLFCTSIGLVHRSDSVTEGGTLLCGVIYNPLSEECYTAEKGKGAFLNGKRIQTSSWSTLGECLVSVSFPTLTTLESPDYQAFQKAVSVCQAIRRTGSTALNLAFVAAGRFDATWAFQCHSWDIAAGALLVREAGGIVELPRGLLSEPSPIRASANQAVERELRELLL